MAGDLNDVLGGHEVKGDTVNEREARCFAKRLDMCHLMDLGAVGHRCTWRGSRKNGVRIFRRLDRGVCNDLWRLAFPDVVVKVHTRVDFSDHHPISINMAGLHRAGRRRPFQFERAWQAHQSFNEIIGTCWNLSDSIV